MKFLYLVWSNLKRKKLRTSLTLLSVLVAFVLFSLLSGLKLALGAGVAMADANRLMVHHRVSFIQPLPHSYQTRIARIPGVTGRDLPEWFRSIESGPAFLRCEERAHWLADEHGLTHGYASAIVHEYELRRRTRLYSG